MDSCTTETMPDDVMAKDVPVQIEGATYSCFMTNDCDALAQRLLSLGCRAPQDDDFKDKPDLPKPLQDAMLQLMHGRTCFVIAHRLSTVKNSDCIMVLDHGRIIERGSHESLIAQKGTYYQLYTGAFELE